MTETNNEKTTVKWGDREYLLDDLLAAHAKYAQNFYDFARDEGSYDTKALVGLRDAVTDRINQAVDGKAFRGDGTLDTDVADNISIQTQKKGLFKKEKYVEQDNTEWAKYYLNKLVADLKPVDRKKSENPKDWNISKYGLEAYLNGQGLAAKDIFEKYDLYDENNPDSPRSFTARHELLRNLLGGYKNWLQTKGFDFTKNDNEWDDDFVNSLETLINTTDWGDNVKLAASLRKLGAGDEYTTAFTSDKWNLSKSDEEFDIETEKKKQEKELRERVNALNTYMDKAYGTFSALPSLTAQMSAYMGEPMSNFYRDASELLDYNRKNPVAWKSYYDRYKTNFMDAEAAQYILPVLQANGQLLETIIDGVKYVYDPNSIDRNTHTFVAIEPISGKMERRFLYDIQNEMAQIKNKFLLPQGASRYHVQIPSNKEGGVLSMQTGGTFDIEQYLKSLDEKDYETRAAQLGISAQELKERERTPFGNNDALLSNAKFTGNDIIQLATMAVNLGSIFMDPMSGAAVGAGASTVDFINDINRDGFQGHDLWNYVKNLGMDAVGMLPIVGDTLGTLGKVKKGLFNIAPKIIGYLGMLSGVAQTPQIIDSFTKIVDDRDMTTADWQNIATGINLIVSGSRMGKHAYKNARAKNASISNDKLQVEVVGPDNKSKMLILDGDNAKAVRESNHSVEAVNKIINNMEGMQNYKVSPKSSLFDVDLAMPGRKVKNVSTGAEERVWNPFKGNNEISGKANIQTYYDPVKYAEAYSSSIFTGRPKNTLSGKILAHRGQSDVDASGKQNLDQFTKTQQEAVDTDIKALRERAAKHGKIKAERSKKLEQSKAQLDTDKETLQTHQNALSATDATITKRQETIDNIQSWRSGRSKQVANTAITKASNKKSQLEAKKAVLEVTPKSKRTKAVKEEIAQLEKQIQQQQDIIDKRQAELDANSDASLNSVIRAKQAAEKSRKKINKDFKQLRDKILTTEKYNQMLEQRIQTPSKAFNELLNFQPRTVRFNDVDYKFGPEKPFTRQELLDAGLFKQGGSINKNKLNKFLNYGKR